MSDIYCIYHPIDGALTVTAQEREDLLKTGTWFDSPADADRYRDQIEQDILNEQKNREDEMLKKDREQHDRENKPAQAEAQNNEQLADQNNDQENEQDNKPKRKRAQKKPKNDDNRSDFLIEPEEHEPKNDFAELADLKPEDNEHENLK